MLWTFLGQGLSTGCCHLCPPHPTPMWQEGPQGSNVKPAGIFLLMFASNVCHYKKPSKECISGRLLFCSKMATKSGLSSSSNLHHPPHWPQCFFFPHHFPLPTPVPESRSQQLPPSSPLLAQLILSHLLPVLQLHSFTVGISLISSVVPASLLSQPPFISFFASWYLSQGDTNYIFLSWMALVTSTFSSGSFLHHSPGYQKE